MKLWKKFIDNEPLLTMLFLISYMVCFMALYSWNGSIIFLISLFYYALPILFFGFPFLSLLLLSSKKKKVYFGYFSSLTAILYLVRIATSYPVEIGFAGSISVKKLPITHTVAIVCSIIFFLLMATLLFMSKQRKFNQVWNSIYNFWLRINRC